MGDGGEGLGVEIGVKHNPPQKRGKSRLEPGSGASPGSRAAAHPTRPGSSDWGKFSGRRVWGENRRP